MPNLIPIEHQVDLAALEEYRLLRQKMLLARQKFFKLYDSSMAVASQYLSDLPETKTILRLRREIRMATRGTPLTIAEDAVTVAGYVSTQTEMLYNAQSHLIKVAWRELVPLLHPDRGGDTELFQTALAAYRLKDLTYLQDLWITLQKDNLFWRCSKECRYYLETEIKRPEVSLQRLRTKPEFQIVMLARSGKPEVARAFAADYSRRLIVMLQAELNYLLFGSEEPNPSERKNHGIEAQEQQSEDQSPAGEEGDRQVGTGEKGGEER